MSRDRTDSTAAPSVDNSSHQCRSPLLDSDDHWWRCWRSGGSGGTLLTMLARAAFLPTLAYNVLMSRWAGRAWWSRIDSTVVLGALPFPGQAKQLIEEENIGAVISMNENYELKYLSMMEQEWSRLGVQFVQLSVTDIFAAPCQHKLATGVRFIDEWRARPASVPSASSVPSVPGRSVYVHCKAGRTRSATLVACYLIQRHGWTSEQAVAHIRSHRPHILLGPKQWQALRQFEQSLVACKSTPDGATAAPPR